MASLNIQIVLPFTALTGGNMILVELANQLGRRGHDVWMVHEHADIPWTKPRGFLRTQLRDLGFLPWLKWHHIKVPVVRCAVLDDCHVPDADVILASYWRQIPRIAALSRKKGKKIYYVQAYETDFVADPAVKDRVDATYREEMECIVVADWLGDILWQRFGRTAKKICPPLPDDMLSSVPPRRNFSGRCLMQHHTPAAKGIADGLKAFDLAKHEMPGLSLALFGPHSNGEPGHYEKLGQIPTSNMASLYDRHDIFLWPSLREGYGLPPLEAMARGLAVATTDNGGSREFAIDGETALVSPPENPEALAANILRLAKDPALRKNLADNAMKMTRARFNWNHACAEFERIFEE